MGGMRAKEVAEKLRAQLELWGKEGRKKTPLGFPLYRDKSRPIPADPGFVPDEIWELLQEYTIQAVNEAALNILKRGGR